MPKFSTHVALMDPEYKPANFAPGDEVPEWALDLVGDHVLEPEAATGSDEDTESGESDQDQDGDGEDNDTPPADDEPDFTGSAPAPRRGRAKK